MQLLAPESIIHYKLSLNKDDFKNLIVFYAKLLSTAHRILDKKEVGYKESNKTHPHMQWVLESHMHYNYLFCLFCKLSEIYKEKWGRHPGAFNKYKDDLSTMPQNIPITKTSRPVPVYIE